MKIKTSEMSGAALDWAVAKSLGWRIGIMNTGEVVADRFNTDAAWDEIPLLPRFHLTFNDGYELFESHCTALHRDPDGTCWATVGISQCSGNDILEAFLRALVTERSGKEVDVPDELVREDKE